MSNRKKGLVALIVIGAIGLFTKNFISPKIGGWILSFAAITFLWWLIEYIILPSLEIDKICNSIDNRFRRIEKPFGLLDDVDEEDVSSKLISYRIKLVLMPQWEEILKKLASQNNQHPDEFIKEIFNDDTVDKGLFGKWFRFVIFQDEISGIQQIWSDYHKTFLDTVNVEDQIFKGFDFLSVLSKDSDKSKYSDNFVIRPFGVTPCLAYFARDFGGDTLSKIPYYEIIRLLKYIGKNTYQYAIKRFPDDLKKELEENKITYKVETSPLDDYIIDENFSGKPNEYNNNKKWAKDRGIELYDFTVEKHIFETQYYSISINLETFEPSQQPIFQKRPKNQ